MQKAIASIAAGVAWLALSNVAQAARPRTDYVVTPPLERPTSSAVIGSGTILYFNRHGGVYTRHGGSEYDSRTNVNGIGAGTITPFGCGDAKWAQVMACLKDSFRPFNVHITDVDPGNVPHMETVVAGVSAELGLGPEIGGIAPMGCDLWVENPITFAFGNGWSCDVNEICWAAAQETAHAVGLDHSTECTDHMTYDNNCSNEKRFRDVLAPCGEDKDLPPDQEPPNASGPRQCLCTNASQQNSQTSLLQVFGARVNAPPDVYFVRLREGSAVTQGFTIELQVDDDYDLTARVELYIDDQLLESKSEAPFVFTAPAELADGPHTLRARVVDTAELANERSLQVTQQPPCTSNAACPEDTVCQVGECVDGPSVPGGIGSSCQSSLECQSAICASGPGGPKCTERCQPDAATCPDEFECQPAGGEHACWPNGSIVPVDPGDPIDPVAPPGEDGGCGCRVAGRTSRPLPFALAGVLGLAALVVARRRRQTSRR